MTSGILAASFLTTHIALQAAFILRALLRPHREPSARMAWVLVILAVPAIGMLAYFLFGETNIGRKRAARYREASRLISEPKAGSSEAGDFDLVSPRHRHLFRVGQSISGFGPVGGNAAELMPDSDAAIDALVADIDAASDHVHLLFYIWLEDRNGLKIVDAAKRASGRGVTVRAMADDIGSRKMIRSRHWGDMEAAGVNVARALPISNPFLHPIRGRVDLRNHRKMVIIDNGVTYCGSQNCADPDFRIKAKFAPWVDLMVRFEGPAARQNQWLFVQDWMAHVDEDLRDLLEAPPVAGKETGIVAQVIGTGPTVRSSAMPEMFEVLMHGARDELVVTTPYYVPTEPMQSALCAAAHRGVRTNLVLPARNDSWVVAAASRSYYSELLEAGVRIFEYPHGLLHTKSLTLDGEIALIGSANLDRRSFDLNYENNILLQNRDFAVRLRARQRDYIEASSEILASDVASWGIGRRLWNNSIAMLGPVL
ncbi:cardiolipin synthase [Ostreiculturibacter nitratireducens]|uniref:cardiolipin synthase n=1 Tax=Ostreiculturibacter nitratireducens TaxID=3075226 RepID=UPI0031B5ED8F